MTTNVLNYARETTTTTSTGSYSLAGSVSPYETFVSRATDELTGSSPWADVGYMCIDENGLFEIGKGSLTDATPDTLARTTIYASSNGGAAVDWLAGTKQIFSYVSGSLASGMVRQQVRASTTTELDITTGITLDTSAPTSSEGEQILALTITPQNRNHLIYVEFSAGVVDMNAASGVSSGVISIFQGTTNLAAAFRRMDVTTGVYCGAVGLQAYFTANTTGEILVQARGGTTSGTTPHLYINQINGGSYFGDATTSYLYATEIVP